MNPQQTKSIHVLIADDHPLMMAGFADSLAKYGIEVTGHAATPEEIIGKYQALTPDVLVLDIKFDEDFAGLEVGIEVLKKFPNAKIVFLTQFDQDKLIKEGYRLGARAFLTKVCAPAQLADAIQRVCDGELYFLPKVADRLARLAVQGDASPQSQLDRREIEVLTMIAEGLTNSEIAEKLDLSIKTISSISQTIKEKLGTHRTAALARLAVRHGLIDA